MTRVQRWTAWLRAALTPRRVPTLIHLNRGDGPVCYSRGRRPRKGSGWTTDAEAVTCRRCIVAMLDYAQGRSQMEQMAPAPVEPEETHQ